MVINHNLLAMNGSRQFNIVSRRQTKHMEKLSSGYRINRAADDAAGLAISEKMRRLIRGLNKGIENAQDGVSLCQIADGSLNEVHDMLHRLEELSVKAANGTNTESDREMVQQEVDQILSEIDRISETSTFNEQRIFSDGTVSGTGASSGIGAAGTDTVCGDFTVTGGTLGKDYTFENGVLKIISDTSITIRNANLNVATTNRIEVASGVNADITLAGVNIDVSSMSGTAAFMIADNSTGNVTIMLADGTNNVLKSGGNCAGLQKSGDSPSGTLIIEGNTGTLTATGGSGAAGIGGGSEKSGSNITISGGNVAAVGGNAAAGIGGGSNRGYQGGIDAKGSNITISGGNVTATGGANGAGIGGGQLGTGSNITISGGSVTATGGSGAAGIGGGGALVVSGGVRWCGNGRDITISGGRVTARGGEGADNIGGGAYGTGSNITISEGALGVSQLRSVLGVSQLRSVSDGSQPVSASVGSKRWWIQCGSESGVGIYIEIESINTETLGIHGMDVTTQESADKAISMIAGALEKVSSVRSNIGAQQNRLEHTIANESNIVENTTAAESLIRDSDVAKEMVGLTTANILAQAGISVLAQANTSNEEVLALLR